MNTGKPKPISPARRAALEVLRRVEAEGAYASLALDHALGRKAGLSTEDRSLATELVYGTLRWRRRLDYALAAHSRRPLERIEPSLLRILRLTAYQLMFLDRVPVWAAVDEGTSAAIAMRGKSAAGFVNAVARGLAGALDRIEWPNPEQDAVRALAVLHSFPDWMVEWWLQRFGPERAVHFMEAVNRPAPLWVRTNTLRVSSEGLLSLLSTSGLTAEASREVPGAVRIDSPGEVRSIAAHEAGLLHVQDAAAQAVCHLVDPRAGQRVLDACAAPGGKTATLAQLMNNEGEIISIDTHPARLALVRKLADRLGLKNVKAEAADLSGCKPEELGLFDRVLIDAPCSALGVLRRHPEGKWRQSLTDVEHMARLQADLLAAGARLVKPGGTLVYSVCTFSEAEGPLQVEAFLGAHPEFERQDPRQGKRAPWHHLLESGGVLATWPDLHDMDAFFAVRLVRKG